MIVLASIPALRDEFLASVDDRRDGDLALLGGSRGQFDRSRHHREIRFSWNARGIDGHHQDSSLGVGAEPTFEAGITRSSRMPSS